MGKTAEHQSYFGKILQATRTIIDGMSVTLSHMIRPPITIQYPDKTGRPVTEMLPERYRGFLEVDLDICTACLACERACPIDCIQIDVEGKGKEKYMTRFDIDMAKCMYCGLCVDPCPTNAIRMTREFEATTEDLASLVFRFVPVGDTAPQFKPNKGEDNPATVSKGLIARRTRDYGLAENPGRYRRGKDLEGQVTLPARKKPPVRPGKSASWLALAAEKMAARRGQGEAGPEEPAAPEAS